MKHHGRLLSSSFRSITSQVHYASLLLVMMLITGNNGKNSVGNQKWL